LDRCDLTPAPATVQQERRSEFTLNLELGRRSDLSRSHPVDIRSQSDQPLTSVLTRFSIDKLLPDNASIVRISANCTQQRDHEVIQVVYSNSPY
jgi:hypothetical protein